MRGRFTNAAVDRSAEKPNTMRCITSGLRGPGVRSSKGLGLQGTQTAPSDAGPYLRRLLRLLQCNVLGCPPLHARPYGFPLLTSEEQIVMHSVRVLVRIRVSQPHVTPPPLSRSGFHNCQHIYWPYCSSAESEAHHQRRVGSRGLRRQEI